MPHYLNNCANRDHKKLYGDDAFYDLDTSGSQATKHYDFRRGDLCVVASQPTAETITFAWYKFIEFRFFVDDKGMNCRVLFGTFEKDESMPKTDAAEHKYYLPFFDKNGNFKRQSVL